MGNYRLLLGRNYWFWGLYAGIPGALCTSCSPGSGAVHLRRLPLCSSCHLPRVLQYCLAFWRVLGLIGWDSRRAVHHLFTRERRCAPETAAAVQQPPPPSCLVILSEAILISLL